MNTDISYCNGYKDNELCKDCLRNINSYASYKIPERLWYFKPLFVKDKECSYYEKKE